jgi:hypothetical protein
MDGQLLGAARIFASHYQLVICDDPAQTIGEADNWDHEKLARGFAGTPTFRMVGTAADLNNHWVELVAAGQPPSFVEWQRITCVHFRSTSGEGHVMSVVDHDSAISAAITPGDYTVYVAAQNVGIDQSTLGEYFKLADAEIARRKDIEWYRLFLVPGKPATEGRVVDRP